MSEIVALAICVDCKKKGVWLSERPAKIDRGRHACKVCGHSTYSLFIVTTIQKEQQA